MRIHRMLLVGLVTVAAGVAGTAVVAPPAHAQDRQCNSFTQRTRPACDYLYDNEDAEDEADIVLTVEGESSLDGFPSVGRSELPLASASGGGVGDRTPLGVPALKSLTPECVRGNYVHDITVSEWPNGSLKISITPMDSVKNGGALANLGNAGEVTAGVDAGLKSCVAELGGLDATESLSIYQQLECHVQLEPGFLLANSGPTWDLESWRVPLSTADRTGYLTSECLNTR